MVLTVSKVYSMLCTDHITDGSGIPHGVWLFESPTVWALYLVFFWLAFLCQFLCKSNKKSMNKGALTVEGAIHSIESMGLVDGPGVRGIIFLRGCKLRCQYCHNPDTWHGEGDLTEVAGLVRRMVRLKPYFMSSGGGITISGGEPLLQPAFLTELLRRLKAEGMHTCIDTAGVGLGNYDSILENTDLVLYDVKHWNPAGYLVHL